MKLRTFVQIFAALSLVACSVIASSTATPVAPSPANLPDLVVSSVYLGMQGIPGYPGCVPAYSAYEIRAVIENRGTAPVMNVSVIEQSTQHQAQIGALQPGQHVEIQIPLSAGGSYTVVVDPANAVAESDESNNVSSYLAPTPTPPAICTPTLVPGVSTLPPATPSPTASS